MMDRNEKLDRLRKILEQIAPEGSIESLARPASFSGTEAIEAARLDEETECVDICLQKIARETPSDQIDDNEIYSLEAIVMPRERPVAFIQNDTYGALPDPWEHFSSDNAIRKWITQAIPSIGRVELIGNPRIPYGGTGFIVGPNLMMTNRHVAELFADGVGQHGLMFRPGQSASLNFRREKDDSDDDQSAFVRVREVVMIHPFWDMALLRVDELPDKATPLKLSVRDPEELFGREIAVIGYPARDDRNDLAIQDRIFQGVYNVKRIQPGKIRSRDGIQSFGNLVNAITHDSSTLGGNSGSAVIDVTNGEIVALHFAGEYLKANYAVPTYELARDARVVGAGVNFTGQIALTDDWNHSWQ